MNITKEDLLTLAKRLQNMEKHGDIGIMYTETA